MSQTLTITRGLPGCGKTTFATQMVDESENTWRVNMDTLREMLWPGSHENFTSSRSFQRDRIVAMMRDTLILELLEQGYSVVCDDTNLSDFTVNQLSNLAASAGVDFVVHDMRDIDAFTCIARDRVRGATRLRGRRVGVDVIMDMAVRNGLMQ